MKSRLAKLAFFFLFLLFFVVVVVVCLLERYLRAMSNEKTHEVSRGNNVGGGEERR